MHYFIKQNHTNTSAVVINISTAVIQTKQLISRNLSFTETIESDWPSLHLPPPFVIMNVSIICILLMFNL